MLTKILLYLPRLVARLYLYPLIVIQVMRKKHRYDKNKKQAWAAFYSMNKKWLHKWYTERGLKSKPPVFYDQDQCKWVKLSRESRRKLTREQKSLSRKSKMNH